MMEILKYPDPRLKQLSPPVTDFGPALNKLLDDMSETMVKSGGIGLAGPQVGYFRRLFVVDLGLAEGQEKKKYEIINPMIYGGEGTVVFDEGCLSLVGISVPVRRHSKIQMRYQDRDGVPRHLAAAGLLSVCFQHENDHLDGVLTLDRVPFWKRWMLKRELNKK